MNPYWLILSLGILVLILAFWLQRERSGRITADRSQRQLNREMRDLQLKAEREGLMFRVMTESSAEALLLLDQDLRIRYTNTAAINLFGELESGSTLIGYTGSLQLEEFVREVIELAEEEALERELRFRERVLHVHITQAEDMIGVALTDISEFQRLSRARQDMVANLSHELRTPLTSLRLLTDTLSSPTGKDSDVAADLLLKISSEVDNLEQIAQEMLDLAAIESGQQVVRLMSERLADILHTPLARMENQAKQKDVELKLKIPSAIHILADADQASRAVLNVLHNALKFSPEASEVSIEAESDVERGMVTLAIKDQGPGIHPEDLERIFERFYRGDRARNAPGTGLGLAIVRHIMRAHGGKTWAENRLPPDVGAAFFLQFQIA
jgi:two-component system phosphate regulon sensor histidine kinase PhoR